MQTTLMNTCLTPAGIRLAPAIKEILKKIKTLSLSYSNRCSLRYPRINQFINTNIELLHNLKFFSVLFEVIFTKFVEKRNLIF